jgi:hypothetical protein
MAPRKLWETVTFLEYFPQHDRVQDKLQGKFQDRQTPPGNSLKLIEFETYCIKPTPPPFFHQPNMSWSRIMVHSHFTLCLRACDYINLIGGKDAASPSSLHTMLEGPIDGVCEYKMGVKFTWIPTWY